jgi:hypothetical protein
MKQGADEVLMWLPTGRGGFSIDHPPRAFAYWSTRFTWQGHTSRVRRTLHLLEVLRGLG